MSANHNGSLSRALSIVRAAKECGADAIKLQTYTPDTMTLKLNKFKVSEGHPLWGNMSLYQLYKEAMTPWEWHKPIFDYAKEIGIEAFSTPFDRSAVDFLEKLDCPIYKIASLETGDIDLISYVASKRKRMIISTGASTLEEINYAVQSAKEINSQLTLLVCTSSYPADAVDAHVKRILTLRDKFNLDVGLSDHTLGIGVSLAAISLGATVIEKHLILKRSDGGHDAAFSLEPDEFKFLVEEGTKAHLALGSSEWEIQDSEAESRRLRRSLYIIQDVKEGEIATRENIKALRPNFGGPIKSFSEILGRPFAADFPKGSKATLDCVKRIEK
jgi:N-acetylneuraminate synthase